MALNGLEEPLKRMMNCIIWKDNSVSHIVRGLILKNSNPEEIVFLLVTWRLASVISTTTLRHY
jgi:hypothetical protein